MAQHIPIEDLREFKAIRIIESGVRYDVDRSFTGLRGSKKWSELPKDYCEGQDTAVFGSSRKLPLMVLGTTSVDVEVHLTGIKQINAIYVVA